MKKEEKEENGDAITVNQETTVKDKEKYGGATTANQEIMKEEEDGKVNGAIKPGATRAVGTLRVLGEEKSKREERMRRNSDSSIGHRPRSYRMLGEAKPKRLARASSQGSVAASNSITLSTTTATRTNLRCVLGEEKRKRASRRASISTSSSLQSSTGICDPNSSFFRRSFNSGQGDDEEPDIDVSGDEPEIEVSAASIGLHLNTARDDEQDEEEPEIDMSGSADASSHLIVARRVESPPNYNLPIASEERQRAMDDSKRLPSQCLHMLMACAGISLSLIGIAILIVFVTQQILRGHDKNVHAKASPNETFTQEYLQSIFPNSTFAKLTHPGSPQALAYQWLIQDPNLHGYPIYRIRQRMALAAVYYATAGDQWTHNDAWLSYDHHECDWYLAPLPKFFEDSVGENGFYEHLFFKYADPDNSDFTIRPDNPCGGANNQYQYLSLPDNNLQGFIPDEFYWLTDLKGVNLALNNLQGTLSTQIGNLHQLRCLGLMTNSISGVIPNEVGSLEHLRLLLLTKNQLSGELPISFIGLRGLEVIWLEDNRLSGVLPSTLGQFSLLLHLDLRNNKFQGTIPTEIGLLGPHLSFLHLGSNSDLTGTMPTQLGRLTEVRRLQLCFTSLHGPIPTELSQLSVLDELDFSDTPLHTTVPSQLGRLSGLLVLDLANCDLSGSIPTSLGQLPQLEGLYLRNNEMTGGIPTQLGLLSPLKALSLRDNLLTSSIPSQLGLLTSLEVLWLFENDLTGSIPQDLCELGQIATLRLEENKIGGSIPSCFCGQPSLEIGLDCQSFHDCTCLDVRV